MPDKKEYHDNYLSFDKRVAKLYGLPEAVVINKFQQFINYNKSRGVNYHLGRTWTFNSYEKWISEEEGYFTCFSKEQMRRILESLVEKGVLIKSEFNKRRNDKTNWYAFVEEEKWIDAKSPISNYGSERPDGAPLPESADEMGSLFDGETLPESANQKDETSLPNSTDENSNQNPLPISTDQKEETAEIGKPLVESDTSICRNQQIDLPESANLYQLKTKALQFYNAVVDNDGGDMKTHLEILTEIVDLEVIECVQRNYHEALRFDFNDQERVDKEVKRLFRMFVGMDNDKMNDINVSRIKNQLIDTRPALSRSVCWVIILRAFSDYPSWKNDFKNIKGLLGRIDKQKQKYIDDLERENKKAELHQASIDRITENKSAAEEAAKLQTEAAERVECLLDAHHALISARMKSDLLKMIEEGKASSAEVQLIGHLSDKGITFEMEAL